MNHSTINPHNSPPINAGGGLRKAPPLGVGCTYYGSVGADHAEAKRQWLKAGIPVYETHGCAYWEMSRTELLRRALERRSDGLETLIICDPQLSPTPAQLQDLVDHAQSVGGVVSATYGRLTRPKTEVLYRPPAAVYPWWSPEYYEPLALAAIPTALIAEVAEVVAASDPERSFSNSPFTQEVMPPFYPLVSPWVREGVSLIPGARLSPDHAFIERVRAIGLKVEVHPFEHLIASPPPQPRSRRANWDADRSQYVVAVASYGALDCDQQKALWELEKAGTPIFELNGCPYIDLARDVIASEVLMAGFDGVVMIDHDIEFVPRDVLSLAKEAAEQDAVVGAPYCMRKPGHSLIGAFAVEAGQSVTHFEGGGLYPAIYTGMGFTAIPRSVLLKVGKDLRPGLNGLGGVSQGSAAPRFALKVEHGYYAGEDVSFCSRVQNVQAQQVREDNPNNPHCDRTRWVFFSDGTAPKILLDTRPRIFHRGAYDYGVEDVGIVVPRLSSVKALLAPDRQAAAQLLQDADRLAPTIQAAALGLKTEQVGSKAAHPLLSRTHEAPPDLVDALADKSALELLERVYGAHFDSHYMGIQTSRNPLDAWVVQEIIYETAPSVIIEVGSFHGGSAVMLKHQLHQVVPYGCVISIDPNQAQLDARALAQSGDYLQFVTGRAEHPETFEKMLAALRKTPAGRASRPRIMVIEDSSHEAAQCLQVLERYAPLVTAGCYLVVEDSICHHGVKVGPNPGPFEAIQTFLKTPGGQRFSADKERERFVITNNPGGYLRAA